MVAHRHPRPAEPTDGPRRQFLLDALRERVADIRRDAERTPHGSPERRQASALITRAGLAVERLLPADTAEGQMARALCELGARGVLTRVRGPGRRRYVPRTYRVSA